MKVSEHKLDRMRLGELDANEERDVLDALQAAGEMHRLDELIEAADAYYTHYPPEVAVAEIREARRRAARQTTEKKPMIPRLVLAAIAATVLAVSGWMYFDRDVAPPASAEDQQAAAARATASATEDEPARLVIEQLYVEAERHDRENNIGIAADLYGRIADDYALQDNPGVYLQSVLRRGLYEHAKNDHQAARERFKRVIALHASIDTPTALGTDAAAQAQFMLAEQAALAAVSESLNEPDEATLKLVLERKTRAGMAAEKELEKVFAYDRPRWSVAAYTRIGTLYREFATSIRASVIPERLSAVEREKYREVLEQSARGVEKRAVESLRKAVTVSEDEGIANAETSAARLALAQLQSNDDTDVGAARAAPPEARSNNNGDLVRSALEETLPEPFRSMPNAPEQTNKLTRTDIKKTLSPLRPEIRRCAELDGPGGTVKVKFYIQPNGAVRDPQVVSAEHRDSAQGDCVRKVVAKLRFPAFAGDKDVPITYPFVLPAPRKQKTERRGSADDLYNAAMTAFLRGSYSRALDLSQEAIENGCTKKCYRISGMANHKLGNREAACRWLDKAGAERPSDLQCD